MTPQEFREELEEMEAKSQLPIVEKPSLSSIREETKDFLYNKTHFRSEIRRNFSEFIWDGEVDGTVNQVIADYSSLVLKEVYGLKEYSIKTTQHNERIYLTKWGWRGGIKLKDYIPRAIRKFSGSRKGVNKRIFKNRVRDTLLRWISDTVNQALERLSLC